MDKSKLSLSTTVSKISFSKFKGRPASLPVSTVSFRFNPSDEGTVEALSQAGHDEALSEGEAHSEGAAVKSDGRRSSSLEERTPSSTGSDVPPWYHLGEIKDKIARTVEEKFYPERPCRRKPNLGASGKRDGADAVEDWQDCEEAASGKPEKAAVSAGSSVAAPEEYSEDSAPMNHATDTPQSVGADGSSQACDINYTRSRRPVGVADIISVRHATLVLLAALVYGWMPLPSFLKGFIFGCVLGFVVVSSWLYLTAERTRVICPPAQASLRGTHAAPTDFASVASPGTMKVWMSELLTEYSVEEFHINQTQSVFVRLAGSSLRLSYPKVKIPKRAMWNEPVFDVPFLHQRHCNLEGATVSLLPEGLARKRHWNRKYPICLRLHEDVRVVNVGIPAHLSKEDEGTLILFARSGREKEEWFHRLCSASGAAAAGPEERCRKEYALYMSRLVSTTPVTEAPCPTSVDGGVAWLNALLGRGLWDLLKGEEWADEIKQRIQKKLSMIKVPYFVEELRITDLELGSHLPQLSDASRPMVDEKGLWVDFGVSYYGAFRMTLETKLNLLRLKKEASADPEVEATGGGERVPLYDESRSTSQSLCDSDAEESAESSSDDEDGDQVDSGSDDGSSGGGTAAAGGRPGSGAASRKLLRLVDTIAQSRYFQQATEYKYVKRAMDSVSNTRLILSVEILSLSGTLTVNLPPPPTDRLWYGFRDNPSLVLVAKPKVGEREVNFVHVVDWIEKKLVLEFQRLMVLPNMDDVIIPFMNSGTAGRHAQWEQ